MKKLFTFFTTFVVFVSQATAAVVDGTCGDNLTWSLNTKDSTLVISGSGAMNNYEYNGGPWCTYSSYIAYVSLPEGLTGIGKHAFYECSKIKSIVIPEGVLGIGNGCFYNCTKLESVTFPSTLNRIEISAFYGCKSLKSVNLPYGLTVVRQRVFEECTSLISLDIPNSVVTIEDYAFYNCKKLTSVVIPNSVETLGSMSFSGCTNLTSVTIGTGVKRIYSSFYGDSKLSAVYITDIVAWCGISFDYSYNNPLYYAHKLYLNGELITDLVIPDGVQRINSHAFTGCNGITTAMIGKDVSALGNGAFTNCAISSLTVYASTPPTNGHQCGITNTNCSLYVKEEAVDTYSNTIWWEDFFSIQPIQDSYDIIVNIADTACDVYEWDGDLYTTSGLYQKTYSASIAGADSIVNLSLVVNKSYNLDTAIVAVGSYAWAGVNYTESTVISYTGKTVDGCDSIVRIDLTIVEDGDIITTNPSPIYKGYEGEITITYDPTQGNRGLMNSSHCYAHTGLLTSYSYSTSDWKHVRSSWGSYLDELTKVGDKWQMTISSIYDFYVVSIGTDVRALAFVFYDDELNVGKTENEGDIFVYLAEPSTDIKNISVDGLTPIKVLKDGEIIIVRGDAEYSILGTRQK